MATAEVGFFHIAELPPIEEPPKPRPLHEEMDASIERTGLITSVRIPQIPAAVLRAGNERVQAEYGDDARQLIIVGPDAIALDQNSGIEQVNQSVAELLGHIIAVRELVVVGHYYQRGLFGGRSAHAQEEALSRNRKKIEDLFAGVGTPLIRRVGNHKNPQFGMDDVVVRDLRLTRPYKESRKRHATELFTDFILHGDSRPSMAEEGMFEGARMALRTVTDKTESEINGNGKEKQLPLSREQAERHRLINEQQRKMLLLRTEQQSDGESAEQQSLRHEVLSSLLTSWSKDAACAGMPEDFYPPSGFERKYVKIDRENRAKAICDSCKVKAECLERALEEREPHGVWGGLNEVERKQLLGVPSRHSIPKTASTLDSNL